MTQNVVKVGQRLRVTSDVVTGGKRPKKAPAAPPKRVSGTLPASGAAAAGGASSGRGAAMARKPRP